MSNLRPPIFAGGMFRSGTSLFRAMLGQHSAISAGLETAWFELDWENGRGRGSEALSEYVARTSGFYDEDLAIAKKMAADSADPEAFIDKLLEAKTRRDGSKRWVEKTPGNVRFADRIFRRWPDARMVHIIRDPRDVFASLRQGGKWDTVEEFSSRWCETFSGWEGSKKSGVVTDENGLEIRYESLVLDPARTMAKVLEFAGESWDPSVSVYSPQDQDYKKVLEATGKASTPLARLAKPLSKGRIGIWQDTLSTQEILAAEAYVNDRGLGEVYRRCFGEKD